MRADLPFLALFRAPEGGVACAIHLEIVDAPGAWGIILADVVQHLTSAYAEKGMSASHVRANIMHYMVAELATPSDKAEKVEGSWPPACEE